MAHPEEEILGPKALTFYYGLKDVTFRDVVSMAALETLADTCG